MPKTVLEATMDACNVENEEITKESLGIKDEYFNTKELVARTHNHGIKHRNLGLLSFDLLFLIAFHAGVIYERSKKDAR